MRKMPFRPRAANRGLKARPTRNLALSLLLGLLAMPLPCSGSVASAQVNLTSPAVARGAIREATQALNAAIKGNSLENLAKAIKDAQDVIQNLDTLGELGTYAKELGPLQTAYFQALGKFLDLSIKSCEKGNLNDGFATAHFMRSLSAATKGKISGYANLEKRLQGCTKLTLMIDSMITNGDLKYVAHVDVKVNLTYSVQQDWYSGKGTITKIAQKFEDPYGNCTVKLTFTPADFTVQRLGLTLDKEFNVKDAILQDYLGGQTNEAATISCPKIPAQTIPFMSWWTIYSAIHSSKNNISIEDWKAGTAPILLRKHIEQSVSDKVTISESTDYLIVKAK